MKRVLVFGVAGVAVLGLLATLALLFFLHPSCPQPPHCIDEAQVSAIVDETEFATDPVRSFGFFFWPSDRAELQDAGLWVRLAHDGKEAYVLF
jgi:hypothetical protein